MNPRLYGVICFWSCLTCIASAENLAQAFADPPLKYATRPLWFWNNTTVTAEGIVEQMQAARDKCGYGGFGILPFGKEFAPKYLTEEYFQMYGVALDKARALGMTMCIYDEYGFPSGSAGAINGDGVPRFANQFPDHTIKRLDKHEQDVTGPGLYSAEMPEGRLMSIVAMDMETRNRVDLTGRVKDGKVTWSVPRGTWKVMIFVCVKDGDPNVDYLDPEGVEHFVEMTHQKYYDRFKEYFGTTIDGTFNDEPTLYRAEGRMWTGAFNEKFAAKHGFDPAPFYPALWYDIGPETSAARNYLFGFRSELYATGFPKVIQDWCDEHGITATGHQDQEEVVNPVSVAGDLMLCFKHQDIPGVDKIGGNRPAERFYKVISSAAYNWDKALVMSETYGAMGDISWETLYQVAMEQYSKGINQLIPHAVWYDDKKVTFKPELSWRHDKYADQLSQYNTYMSRLNLMLQNHGRHVADIAVLYPIATLQGSHHLDGELGYYKGGVTILEADYVDVGEILATEVGRDYTFIHPEVLDEKCRVTGSSLVLENPINHEAYRVVIMPGHKTISWSNLKKIKAFYDQGGKVIATGTLPSKSAEFGHDQDVVKAIEAMFPSAKNERGGRAVFLGNPTAATLRDTLDRMIDVYDVTFEVGKELRYIHKVKDGKDIYFLANLGKASISTWVALRGTLSPEAWNPHTGEISGPEYSHENRGTVGVTNVKIELPPTGSLFIIAQQVYGKEDTVPAQSVAASTTIDAHTVKLWSAPYRGWYYHPGHVIPEKPNIKGFETVHMTDVPTVFQRPGDTKWYMTFIGFDGKGYQSFIADSDDLVHWTNRRLAMGYGPEGSFDYGGVVLGAYLYESYDIKAPRTLKKKHGKYFSLYGAYPRQGGYELRPGYEGVASSDDGVTWQRAKHEPILSVHQEDCGPWEKDCIYQPWLVEHRGTYYNFYNAANGSIEQMGLALSHDLLEWKRYEHNPVIPHGPQGSYNERFSSDGKVFRDKDHWVNFFFGVGHGGAHVMMAFSLDLIHWTVDPDPIYKSGANPSGLDKQYAHKISLVWNPANETYYMFYNAVGDQGRGIGLITSKPLVNPQ